MSQVGQDILLLPFRHFLPWDGYGVFFIEYAQQLAFDGEAAELSRGLGEFIDPFMPDNPCYQKEGDLIFFQWVWCGIELVGVDPFTGKEESLFCGYQSPRDENRPVILVEEPHFSGLPQG